MIVAPYEILVVNGPNLRFIGSRDTHVYGFQTIQDIPAVLEKRSPEILSRTKLEFFQANGEGQIIDRLERAWKEKTTGLLINPGAYTHTSLALADCLAWIGIPFVEVHLSNVWSREEIRHQSLSARHALGVVAGFGIDSYIYGLQALVDFLSTRNTNPED